MMSTVTPLHIWLYITATLAPHMGLYVTSTLTPHVHTYRAICWSACDTPVSVASGVFEVPPCRCFPLLRFTQVVLRPTEFYPATFLLCYILLLIATLVNRLFYHQVQYLKRVSIS